MRIPDRKREPISRLIAVGENLDPVDLEAFYLWVHDSYEALEPHPLHRGWFDEFCRSSGDANSKRIYVGVRILRMAAGEVPSNASGCRNRAAHFE